MTTRQSMQPHIPVLLEDVLTNVRDIEIRDGIFIDGTFGRGGHAAAIMRARPDFRVIAFDCDEEAIVFGKQHFAEEISNRRLTLQHGNFSDFDQLLKTHQILEEKLAGILLDLGVSSPQLDEGHRGFSFYKDGPLDMRMNTSQEFTAADIINGWDEEGLNELFRNLGEVRRPFRVTQKILDARKQKAFTTTGEVAALIERAEGWQKKGHHPATNFFLALRLEVNQELARVEKALPQMMKSLAAKGRLLVITFHSLEDRIVKVAFKGFEAASQGHLVNKKVIQAEWDEKKSNPRARSAKLRVFEKGESS